MAIPSRLHQVGDRAVDAPGTLCIANLAPPHRPAEVDVIGPRVSSRVPYGSVARATNSVVRLGRRPTVEHSRHQLICAIALVRYGGTHRLPAALRRRVVSPKSNRTETLRFGAAN